MELDKLRELIEMMKANDLSELEIIDGPTRIALKRGATVPLGPALLASPSAAAATTSAGAPHPAPGDAEAHLAKIVSPIVGTFYAAPSPNADPFVTVGTHVDPDTVVCLIEAMKVMNEIKSGAAGAIRKVLVANGSAVEYGQPLFSVEPD